MKKSPLNTDTISSTTNSHSVTSFPSNSMLQTVINSGAKLTPMVTQYVAIKQKYPDILLFYRMGDFYELFFDDAKEASHLLGITLTHRGKIGDFDIPMAGVPFHSANNYVERLTSRGYKVAICEQVEDPALAKGIVRREVVQIVSPGMPYDLDRADAKEPRYMVSMAVYLQYFYLAFLDFTTGDFFGIKVDNEEEAIQKIGVFTPKELITYPGQWDAYPNIKNYLQKSSVLKTYLAAEYFSAKNTNSYIEKLVPAYTRDRIIQMEKGILSPLSALSFYVCSNNVSDSSWVHLRPFRMHCEDQQMKVTAATLIGLEIIPATRDKYRDSLLGFIDRTQTAMGARELRQYFLHPSRSLNEITARQECIDFFLKRPKLLLAVRQELESIRDLERIMAKVSTNKVTAQDLLGLANSIKSYQSIIKMAAENSDKYLAEKSSESGPNSSNPIPLLKNSLWKLEKLANKILSTINDEIGASLENGNLIKRGAVPKRDKLQDLGENNADKILQLENKYRSKTNIGNLKIKYNNISGHFIEVSKSHLSKVPSSFERRQTLVNAERFITKELLAFEEEVLMAKDRLEQMEKQIFEEIVQEVLENATLIIEFSAIISRLDILQALAWVAQQESLVRPVIHYQKKILQIQGGWHPLIKNQIRNQFVCHDLKLDENNYLGLITGPNMAGKTTVMREMAIIQFLGQLGSFVPANHAEIGLCDYLFSRLGAQDDILRGQSTFMVEMTETAEILRHATERSFIVIDEVGRGTSTYDGLSIAWALLEYLTKSVCALTLFSTHYHELITVVKDLSESLGGRVKNFSVETVVKEGTVQFLYRLIEKGAEESYGIYVAKLAGLPSLVLKRAESILNELEKTEDIKNIEKEIPEFKKIETENAPFPVDLKKSLIPEINEDLLKIDVMNLTPLQAMEKLYQLQNKLLRQ